MALFTNDNWEFDIPDKMLPYISDINLSYIAGIVDGEGCITSSANRKGVTVECIIRTADSIIVPYLYKLLGFGSFKYLPNIEQYQLRFTGDGLILFLCLIYPYLKLKKEQANLMLELMCIRKGSNTHFQNLPTEQIRISASIRELNQRFRK